MYYYYYEQCLRVLRCAKFQKFVGPNAFSTLAQGNSRRYADLMEQLMQELMS